MKQSIAFLALLFYLVLLQGNLLLDIQTESSIQTELGSPERGLAHREVAGRWMLAVDMKQTPLTSIYWVSQKDPEIRRMGKALDSVQRVLFNGSGDEIPQFFLN